MVLLALIAAISLPVCGLLAWVFYLRTVRHFLDSSGPDAVRQLPAVARAFLWAPAPRRGRSLDGGQDEPPA